MCKIKSLDACEKRIIVELENGTTRTGNWYTDDDATISCRDLLKEREIAELNVILNSEGIEEYKRYFVNYNKYEEDTYFISRHAYQRLKERVGWNKKTANRMLKKVVDCGKVYSEMPKAFKRWVSEKVHDGFSPAESRIYGENLFLVDESSHIFVTVLPLPVEIRKQIAYAA